MHTDRTPFYRLIECAPKIHPPRTKLLKTNKVNDLYHPYDSLIQKRRQTPHTQQVTIIPRSQQEQRIKIVFELGIALIIVLPTCLVMLTRLLEY